MTVALELEGLTVHFTRFSLGLLDLTLEPGRVVGLVGPNGSGKTTTLRCVAGNLYPDGGTFSVFGRGPAVDDGSWKTLIGFVPDHPQFYEWMTGRRLLAFVSDFYPDWAPELAMELSSRFRLDLEERVDRLSKGNRVKLSLVAALAHLPRLALFDEPTAGLDPVVRREVFEVLGEMMEQEEMTVLYSAHILDDLHRLADELVFLRDGQVQMLAAKDDLVDRWRRLVFRYEGEPSALDGVVEVRRIGDVFEVISSDGERTEAALAEAGAENVRIAALELEEIAVNIMKGNGHA
jgi:ABC-2 type transport system ATP-binding protein